MSKKKTNGEVFTPNEIIDFMLNKTYNPKTMDYILEPGCGDGRFIISIIKRIIEEFHDDNEIIDDKISKIYGIELDSKNYLETLHNIEFFLSNYPLIRSRPIILNEDALLSEIHDSIKWSYIVGNPPYIRIHNLNSDYLNILQDKYDYLKNGMVDLYYGFFELHKKLHDDGVLCFITPSSYLYNTSGELLFNDLYNNRLLKNVVDFTSERMFENASTYTCVTTLQKNSQQFTYQKSNNEFNINFEKTIEFNIINNGFIDLIQNNVNNQSLFKDRYKVKTGFATLLDKLFVINQFVENDETITFKKNKVEYTIEKSITKKCVKASKYNGHYHRVIFPYKNIDGVNVPMTEGELRDNYPLAFNYMFEYKDKLMLRDKGKIPEDKWFLWGRTQGINKTYGSKVVISPIYLSNPFIYFEEDVLVYSGYYIIVDCFDDIFTNEIFINSLNSVSKPMAAGWKSLQKKILDNVYL